jgi:hypothetical protein
VPRLKNLKYFRVRLQVELRHDEPAADVVLVVTRLAGAGAGEDAGLGRKVRRKDGLPARIATQSARGERVVRQNEIVSFAG